MLTFFGKKALQKLDQEMSKQHAQNNEGYVSPMTFEHRWIAAKQQDSMSA